MTSEKIAKRKAENEWELGFSYGVLYAVARIVELHDEPGIAADVLNESGVDPRRAESYDRKFINKAARELRGRRGNS